jgi:hypothetical protein
MGKPTVNKLSLKVSPWGERPFWYNNTPKSLRDFSVLIPQPLTSKPQGGLRGIGAESLVFGAGAPKMRKCFSCLVASGNLPIATP